MEMLIEKINNAKERSLQIKADMENYKTIIVDANKLSYINNMSIFMGDITTLRADAIVNAGNSNMLGSFEPCDSSIDNVIMSAGGLQIRQELNFLMSNPIIYTIGVLLSYVFYGAVFGGLRLVRRGAAGKHLSLPHH